MTINATTLPLAGIRVIDFSTLLPGPMCTLLLARAGADVIKVERPGRGDEMRSYTPRFGVDSVNFALLNQGKRSVALDLKDPAARAKAVEWIRGADVVVEQFRPGVMDRLGLGYAQMREVNPRLVYCSITGWGQSGPFADVAAHDLNYQAESGMLGVTAGADGAPGVPSALVADIGGGAYPAVMNILLALRARDGSGEGCHIDVSMADNLLTFLYWGLGNGFVAGEWPTPGGDLVTGGTPRYNIYRTRDGRYLAAAPLEQKFWENFVGVLGAPQLLDDGKDPAGTRRAVQDIISSADAQEWLRRFEGIDACVTIVKTMQEAVRSPQFVARGLFSEELDDGKGQRIPALPVPIAPGLRDGASRAAPPLGDTDPSSIR